MSKNQCCTNSKKFCMVVTCTITRYSVKNSAHLNLSFQSYGKKYNNRKKLFIYSKKNK